jgi:hypothetical protein
VRLHSGAELGRRCHTEREQRELRVDRRERTGTGRLPGERAAHVSDLDAD